MRDYKYIILGAGPSGLSFAHRLLNRGERSFLVIEKEKVPGGLCRDVLVDGSPLDIGGGHFLDTRKKEVVDFLFEFLPGKEWNKFQRISTIKMGNTEIDYPIESHIWQFQPEEQIEYLLSIFNSGSAKGKKMPKKFSAWIHWKFGKKIAEDYMIPYNKKIFSVDLDGLGIYWLYKLPDVSLKETLKSCLEKHMFGTIPAHASFYYPKKYGYGEVWIRMANKLKDKVLLNMPLTNIDVDNLIINKKFKAAKVINTIPWHEFLTRSKLPSAISSEIKKLEFTSVETAYFKDKQSSNAHWTYFPDEHFSYHRILYRYNFCPGSRGYWTETNVKRVKDDSEWNYINKYAYPLNTIDKPKRIKNILNWFRGKGIYGLGRWGEWEHMNSDVAVENAFNFADKILRRGK